MRLTDLDAEIEIDGHPRHHLQLLEISFSPAIAKSGAYFSMNNLPTTVATPPEKWRPEAILQPGRSPGSPARSASQSRPGTLAFDVGIQDQVDILGKQACRRRAFQRRGYEPEILRWRELRQVDEDQ